MAAITAIIDFDTRQISRYAGFTLLETLIVIALISIMSAVAIMSVSGNHERRWQQEAERMHETLQAAAEEAVYDGTEIGLVLTKNSYGFVRYNAMKNEWQLLDNKPFHIQTLNEKSGFKLMESGLPVLLPEETPKVVKPVVLFLSSGEITPFRLILSTSHSQSSFILTTDGIAPITLKQETDQ